MNERTEAGLKVAAWFMAMLRGLWNATGKAKSQDQSFNR